MVKVWNYGIKFYKKLSERLLVILNFFEKKNNRKKQSNEF